MSFVVIRCFLFGALWACWFFFCLSVRYCTRTYTMCAEGRDRRCIYLQVRLSYSIPNSFPQLYDRSSCRATCCASPLCLLSNAQPPNRSVLSNVYHFTPVPSQSRFQIPFHATRGDRLYDRLSSCLVCFFWSRLVLTPPLLVGIR